MGFNNTSDVFAIENVAATPKRKRRPNNVKDTPARLRARNKEGTYAFVLSRIYVNILWKVIPKYQNRVQMFFWLRI